MKLNSKGLIVAVVLILLVGIALFDRQEVELPANDPDALTAPPGRVSRDLKDPKEKSGGLKKADLKKADLSDAGHDWNDKETNLILAMALRKRCREEPGTIVELLKLLGDKNQDLALRQMVAIVLGSLPNPEAEEGLRKLLNKETTAELLTWVIYALGQDKEWKDDFAFDALSGPWVVESPLGLQVLVKRDIADPVTRALMQELLLLVAPELRWQLVRALRHSTEHLDVRDAFVKRFDGGESPNNKAELAEALAHWAASRKKRGAEQEQVLDLIFREAGFENNAALRFKIEDELALYQPKKSERDKVKALFLESKDFDSQYWALNLMGKWSESSKSITGKEQEKLFSSILSTHEESKIRERAAYFLRNFKSKETQAALLKTLNNDSAWNVRHGVIKTLKGFEMNEEIREVLVAISLNDVNHKVREIAKELLD
jgi:hypothetical protein